MPYPRISTQGTILAGIYSVLYSTEGAPSRKMVDHDKIKNAKTEGYISTVPPEFEAGVNNAPREVFPD